MGWSFRKSLRFGPFRVNLSKSGFGASTGAGGANISTGPRGTYVSFSKFGFRFYKKLKGPGNSQTGQGTSSVGSNTPTLPQSLPVSNTSTSYGTMQSQGLNSPNSVKNSNQDKSTFRSMLIQKLTAKPPLPFDYEDIVNICGLTPHESQEVSVSLFESFARGVLSDGVVSDHEKSKIKQLADQLRIDETTCQAIVRKVSNEN